jgi:hypothetical protein
MLLQRGGVIFDQHQFFEKHGSLHYGQRVEEVAENIAFVVGTKAIRSCAGQQRSMRAGRICSYVCNKGKKRQKHHTLQLPKAQTALRNCSACGESIFFIAASACCAMISDDFMA